MEYWEDRNCSEAYLDIIDKEEKAYKAFEASGYSDEGLQVMQNFLREMKKELAKLAPEDFGLANGDYFVDITYHVRKLYKIQNGVLRQHDTNDRWYPTNTGDYDLQHAMGMTMKGKWMRFREAPLGR